MRKYIYKFLLSNFIIITISGCTLYNDIRIDTTYNNGPAVSVSITKPLSDLDTVIRSLLVSENALSVTKIDTAIQRKELLDSIITNYAEIQFFKLQKDILLDDISNYNEFLTLIKSENETKIEKSYDLTIISNEITVKQEELVLNEESFSNNLLVFLKLTGYKISDFDPEKLFSDIDNTALYEIELEKLKGDLANNNLSIRKKILDNFLPELSLSTGVSYYISSNQIYYNPSTGVSYDFSSNQIYYNASSGLNYKFSDIFIRNYQAKILEYQNENLKRDIKAKELENEDSLYSINKMITILENRIKILETNLQIENTNLMLFADLYKKDKIDFYLYKRDLDDLTDYKKNLLKNKSDLFIIVKSLKYGILRCENNS